MSNKIDKVDECLNLSCKTSTVAVKIYNLIRDVGHKKLSADNALHQLIEEYVRLLDVSDRLTKLAHIIEKKE
jgi:hypothetical protein